MGATLVQSVSNASGTASPGSVQPTYAPTAVGNLLLAVVATTGASPVITTPASWTLVTNNSDAARAISLYSYVGNPGAITSVLFTLTSSTGACVYGFEFAGMPLAAQTEFVAAAATNGTIIPGMFPALPDVNELGFWAIGGVTTTLTPVLTPEWSTIFTKASSGGAPNAVLNCAWHGFTAGPATPQVGGTLTAADVYMVGARYFSAQSSPITRCPAGGMSGQLVGSFFQGMIGG